MEEAKKGIIQKVLYITGFLDNCAVSMTNSIIIQALRCQGISPFIIGIIGSIAGTLQIFTGPIMGKLGDVNGWKSLLLLSYISPAIGNLIIGTTSMIPLLVMSRILTGIFKQGQLSRRAYLTELIPSTEHSTVLGHLNACNNIGLTVGPLMGGQIAELDPTLKLPFIVASGIFVLQIILTLVFIPSSNSSTLLPVKNEENNENQPSSTKTFTKALLSKFTVFTLNDLYTQGDMLVFRFVLALSIMTFRRNLPILLEDFYHINAYNIIGMIISFYSAVGVIAFSLSGRISKLYSSSKTLMIHMSLLMCVALVMIALSPWLLLAIVCLVPVGLASALLRIAVIRIMLSRREGSKTGVTNAMEMSMTSMAMAVSPSLVGVAQEINSRTSGMMSGALSVISLGLTLLLYTD